MEQEEKTKKKKNFIKKLIKNKKRRKITLIGIICLAVVIAVSLFLFSHYNGQAKVDNEYLLSVISKSSELTTAKLKYSGLTDYTDEGIDVINKANFTIFYKATVRVGINIDEVKVDSDDVSRTIYVTIPKASVQEVKIDPNSIKYYDTHFALFNTDEKEDSNRALALAEEAAKEELENMGVIQLADEQSATLIKGILANAIPDGYTIEVNQ